MGFQKRLLDRQAEYGFTTFEFKNVCGNCINEIFIKQYIEENACSEYCDYCDFENENDGFIAADMDDVVEFIIDALKVEWGNPDDEGVGYDSREGGYLGAEIYDGWDFILEILCHEANIENEYLIRDLQDKFLDTIWCKVDPYNLPEDKELFITWQTFSEQVKHKTRYVFYKTHTKSTYVMERFNPNEVLDIIGSNVEKLGLIKKLTEQKIYRARVSDKGEYFKKAMEIGPPPKENALNSNRMSPAGIPMFYGGIDEETALLEVNFLPGENVVATIGEFKNAYSLLMLDLTSIPNVPSIFDEEDRKNRWIVKFFYSFLSDFTKPIKKDGKEHIDYVPTQIVTEYFRHIFRTKANQSIDGIIYPSSKNGKKAYVLFMDNQDFSDQPVTTKMFLSNISYVER
ncbi:HEPN-associated N-terminal domain-containing protein [Oceanobacillus kapialis]|uniref:HEPN-associated N-terminal domain-containing protein n=1 Tax=Oceanobacillus kapialis TaxID=481353 RepID=A0ABW5PXM3_9BACI